jgi:hypothetical protein
MKASKGQRKIDSFFFRAAGAGGSSSVLDKPSTALRKPPSVAPAPTTNSTCEKKKRQLPRGSGSDPKRRRQLFQNKIGDVKDVRGFGRKERSIAQPLTPLEQQIVSIKAKHAGVLLVVEVSGVVRAVLRLRRYGPRCPNASVVPAGWLQDAPFW